MFVVLSALLQLLTLGSFALSAFPSGTSSLRGGELLAAHVLDVIVVTGVEEDHCSRGCVCGRDVAAFTTLFWKSARGLIQAITRVLLR